MDLLLPDQTVLKLESYEITDDQLLISASTAQRCVTCPNCGASSARVHSTYTRKPADLPCSGYRVGLYLKVRRFFCENTACEQVTFAEPLPMIVRRYGRRTVRLAAQQASVAFAEGGEAGARLLSRLQMPTSPDTLLRLIRQKPEEPFPTPRVLGVDDWALCKGQRYGTILVDLEKRQPVDLLPDRSADTLANWLQEHPGVEIISRDRANEYIEGASRGAPDAIQVADRFHLLQNVREMLQRLLERHESALRAASAEEPVQDTDASLMTDSSSEPEQTVQESRSPETPSDLFQEAHSSGETARTKAERQKQERQAARFDRFETVRTLHAEGHSQRSIARQLEMSVHTVHRYLIADQFPERATPPPVPSKLDPFIPYLRQQLESGHDNAMQLWRDLRDEFGYTGSRPLVSRWVAQHRHLCPPSSTNQPKPKRQGRPPAPPKSQPRQRRRLSARQAAWMLVRPPEALNENDCSAVERLCHHAETVQVAYSYAQRFIQMVCQRCADLFETWLAQVEATGIPELQGFAAGLRRDKAAVTAALSLPYSNGQVEGQVNRLKLIKRSMYGRASFDLLRKRVLAA